MVATDDLTGGSVAASQGPFVVSHPCPVCHGQGRLDEQACPRCHGTGVERFYHGTKADLKSGDLIKPGVRPNFDDLDRQTTWVYLTGTLDAATWAPNSHSATVLEGSTSWNRPARSRMTPI